LIRVHEGYSANESGKPKSRKSHMVPMADRLAEALEELKQRDHHTNRRDLVFAGRDGGPLDGSALRRRYLAARDAAGLRPLRFHDLRHTFASIAINVATVVQVQAWMGHADLKSTMRYLHHKSHADDARLLSAAFLTSEP
jgi:integrase